MSRLIVSVTLLLAGALVGAGVMWSAGRNRTGARPEDTGAAPGTLWTCSMHPQIRLDHPDICPLCGMDLTPLDARQDPWEAEDPSVRLVLGEPARRLASVDTRLVESRELFKEIRTVGRIELDETRVAQIASRVNGRVEQVFADFPGTPVRRGEHLVSIYSPELLSTQEEYLTALRREQAQKVAGYDSPLNLSAASRRRLQLWGITDSQLDELARTGTSQDRLVVYAPIGGTVIEKKVRPGQYVKEGDALYTIADLGQVWLILEVYESELSWVQVGQPVEVTLESEPQHPVTGTVAFVEPLLTKATRTVQVRVILENTAGRFKPGMYAQAMLRVPIRADGSPAPTGREGMYICPMHPYVVSDQRGACPVCGMALELVAGKPASPPAEPKGHWPSAPLASAAGQGFGATGTASGVRPKVLAVPAEAVLTTGRRQLVYVEREPGKYQLVEPRLGPRAGDWYPVVRGLAPGDRVVTRGAFLLDSQFQITGKTSLLYPEGSAAGELGHAGHGGSALAGFSAKERVHLDKLPPEDRQKAVAQKVCPVTGKNLGSMGPPVKLTLEGRTVYLCCKGCVGKAKSDPAGAFRAIEAAGGKVDAPAVPAGP